MANCSCFVGYKLSFWEKHFSSRKLQLFLCMKASVCRSFFLTNSNLFKSYIQSTRPFHVCFFSLVQRLPRRKKIDPTCQDHWLVKHQGLLTECFRLPTFKHQNPSHNRSSYNLVSLHHFWGKRIPKFLTIASSLIPPRILLTFSLPQIRIMIQ